VTRHGAVVAVDIGGTTLKGAAFLSSGALLTSRTVPTFGADGSALASVLDLLDLLITTSRAHGADPLCVGISTPGLVNSTTGVVGYSANLGWRDLAIADIIHSRFGVPATVEHDARAGAIAETTAMGETDGANTVFLPIGTGIGAAIMTGGVVQRGATGAAGEVGHVPVIAGGELCPCGQRGCLEVYASAANILVRYQRLGGTAAQTTRELATTLSTDALARQVWDEAVSALATGIVSLTATLDPAVIIIGGGLGLAGDVLLAPLRTAVDEQLLWRPAPQLVGAAFGERSSIIGAALLALDIDADGRRTFAQLANTVLIDRMLAHT
jgi:glucokinase